MATDDDPEPAAHDRTIRVGEYELAPGAQLSRGSVGPTGAAEYTSFVVLDVDPETGDIELCRMTDNARRTVPASGIEADLGSNTFVIDDGRGEETEG